MSGEASDSGDSVVELRVHGVSGTPPEELLECPTELLDRVAGDSAAGFYRCRPCCDTRSEQHAAAANGEPIAVREAYSWGGLTSGSASKALWLLFLPFLLINLAHWMLPPSKTGRGAAAVSVTLLRLIGLSFTLTLMLASAQVAMDIVGWQCSAVAHCGAKLGPATFLIHALPGVRVAVTAIPVALMLVGLLLLGRANPEGPQPARQTPPDPAVVRGDTPAHRAEVSQGAPPSPAVRCGDVPLAHPNFWVPDDSVKRLRGCHVMAWASGLAAVALAAPLEYADTAGLYWACVGLLIVNIVMLAAAVAMTAWTPISGRGGPSADRWTRPISWLQWTAVVVLIASLITVACVKTPNYPGPATALPFLKDISTGPFLCAQLGLLVGLFVSTAWCMHGFTRVPKAIGRALYRPWGDVFRVIFGRPAAAGSGPGDGWAPSVEGVAAPFVAAIGLLIAGGFSTGIILWTARYFGTPVRSTPAARCEIGFRDAILGSTNGNVASLLGACDENKRSQLPVPPVGFETQLDTYNGHTPIIIPPSHFANALVFGVLLFILAGIALVVLQFTIPRWARAKEQAVRSDYDEGATPSRDEIENERRDKLVKAVARARALATLTDYMPAFLVWLVEFSVVAFLVVLIYVRVGYPTFFDRFPYVRLHRLPTTIPIISNLSVVVMAAAAIGLVSLAFAAYRSRDKRREVGILWDVITFWPRANHPLTPPCYAERTVPDLKGQLGCLTCGQNRVVLSGHSQGSIISAATLLQADDTVSARVALLTFGCMLRRIYAKNFPAYFGRDSLDKLPQEPAGDIQSATADDATRPKSLREKQSDRWINMWARTDYLGGWVFTPVDRDIDSALTEVDYRLLDVTSLDAGPRGDEPAICGHSGFWKRDEYNDAVKALAAAVRPASVPLFDGRAGAASPAATARGADTKTESMRPPSQ